MIFMIMVNDVYDDDNMMMIMMMFMMLMMKINDLYVYDVYDYGK